MSATVEGISTSKGFHKKVPFAEVATQAEGAKKLSGFVEVPVVDNASSEKVAYITSTGIYLVVLTKYDTYFTDVIAIPNLNTYSNGALIDVNHNDQLPTMAHDRVTNYIPNEGFKCIYGSSGYVAEKVYKLADL